MAEHSKNFRLSIASKTKSERVFTKEEIELKHLYYEKMNPRRRKFVDRLGFEDWDPFEPPKEPMDIRTDATKRTAQDLVKDFFKEHTNMENSGEYARGVLEAAIGVVNQEEKYQGLFDFYVWYNVLLSKEEEGL